MRTVQEAPQTPSFACWIAQVCRDVVKLESRAEPTVQLWNAALL